MMHILYVEDDPTDVDLTLRHLERHAPHLKVRVACTQREAMALIGSPAFREVELVLLDMNLPDGDGLSILSHIRCLSLPVAVVMVTGGGDEETAVAALKAGADNYVAKRSGYLDRLPRLLEATMDRFRKGISSRETPFTVLYAEDSADDIDLTIRYMKTYAPYIRIETVMDGPSVLKNIEHPEIAARYGVILLDLSLRHNNALEIIKELREEKRVDLPIVIVTGRGDEEKAVQAIHLGAIDYIVKYPGYLHKLPTVLCNAFTMWALARERAALLKLNRALKILSEGNGVLVRSVDELSLLQDVCRIIVETGGYRMAWVGFAEYGPEKEVKPAARAGFDEEYLEAASITWDESERGRGPTGTAIRTGKPVVCRDIMTDPSVGPWREDAVRRGYRSFIALPMKEKEHTFGAINIYSGKPDDFDPEEIRLLMELAADLSYGIVALRTRTERDRAKENLRQAQKMEALGTLAGGIAHDFNNILSAIIGFSDLCLMELPKESDLRENIQEVVKAGNRARDLVRQILTFSRKRENERAAIKIHLIVKEALKLLRPSLPTTIEIRQEIASSSTALADPGQIHQVMMNLCTNAYHAMRREGGVLTVRLADVLLDAESARSCDDLQPGHYMVLTVSDTGHGMKNEVMERIFDPYFTTKEKGEGTGLGLAVVLGIVKSHGGAITVESTPGKGSTFRVYFPIIQEIYAAVEIIAPNQIPMGTGRILFVDDEEVIVRVGKKILERLGYDVVTERGSLEALERFKAESDRFDLVITDFTMPKMTGEILAREILAIRPGIPVILCTGYNDQVSEKKAGEIGIRRILMKPLMAGNLADAVRSALDRS